jgi:hypothetical protein
MSKKVSPSTTTVIASRRRSNPGADAQTGLLRFARKKRISVSGTGVPAPFQPVRNAQ